VASAEKQIGHAEANDCLPIVKAWFECLEAHNECVLDAGLTDHNICRDEEELGEDCTKGRL